MSESNNPKHTPIAVVGMASIFANARTLDQYWDNIMQKVDGIMDVPADRWLIDDYYDEDPLVADKTYCKRGGFIPEVDFNPMEFGLPPNILEVTDVAQMISLIVAKEVLKDAGILDNPNVDRDRIGVTLGVGGGQKLIGPLLSRLQYPILNRVLESSGVETGDREQIIEKFKKAYVGWEENSFPGMLGNVISGRIANRFDLGGMNCVVDAACASALSAMKMAVRDLQMGTSDVMLTGGVCCDNSIFMYMSFSKTPAFSPTGIIQPFDHESKGMLVGEGLGMVALKRLEDAERDGDKIYAVIKGVGSSSDGKYKSIYAPRSSGQAKAVTRAYEEAGFDPKTVGLIEAHGTGTVAGDAAEFGGLREVFEHENTRKNHIALGSVKSQIGHTKAAAGVAGFIKVALALHHKVLPPTINVTKPNPDLNIEDSPFYLNTETRPWVRDGHTPRRAGVSAFGFGGTNFHFALEEYKPEISGAYRVQNTSKSVVLAANSKAELQALCAATIADLQTDSDVNFQQFTKQCAIRELQSNQARLGFVAESAEQTIEVLEKASAKLAKDETDAWSTPSGMYFRSSALAADSVVGLFSGQGSQYLNMGKDVALNFPPMLNLVSSMNDLFIQDDATPLSFTNVIYPNPVFSKEDETAQNQTLQLTQYAQPAIGVMSLGLYNILQQAGLKVNSVAGHSFGELTAYCAAGVISESDYLHLAKARGQAMAAPSDTSFDAGTMVAVVGDASLVEGIVSGVNGAQVANFNSGSQVVVAGETAAVQQAKEALKEAGLRVIDLPVSAAFHTPLVAHAQKPFAAAIDQATFNVPAIPIYSNATGQQHQTDVDSLKNQLKDHVLNSVQFKTEIENMYAQGARVFVEFGPKNILSKLTEDILKGREHYCVSLNANPKKNSDTQLRQAAVELAVMGLLAQDVDVYETEREDLSQRVQPRLNVKLTGGSYVSDKTRQIYQDALQDGHKIKGYSAAVEAPEATEVVANVQSQSVASEAIASNLVSELTPQMLEVVAEKTGYPSDMLELSMDMEADLGIDSIKRVEILGAMQDHVGNLPDLDPDELSELRTLQQVVDYLQSKLTGSSTPVSVSAPVATNNTASLAASAAAVVAAPVVAAAVESASAPVVEAQAPAATPVPEVAVVPVVAEASSANLVSELTPQMLEVVAEKTGYPSDMLELSMDMEADLGIDSIKRVEILGAMQDHVGNLPDLDPDELSELRTLQQVVDYLQSKLTGSSAPVSVSAPVATNNTASLAASAAAVVSAPVVAAAIESAPAPVIETQAPVATPVPEVVVAPVVADADSANLVSELTPQMLEVVADKTGYPVDMLELSMDMEADLGIDSIKRVEILGAMQDHVGNLPDLDPDELSELRTLQQVVDYLQSKLTGSSAPVSVSAPVVTNNTASLATSAAAVVSAPVVAAAIESAPAPVIEAQAPVATPVPEVAAAPVVADASSANLVSELTPQMLEVVADKTGYPVDMLELSMDMEADLGIDSIKRVEILGAMQDHVGNLPDLDPDELSELRTLQQVVDYLQSKLTGSSASTIGDSAVVKKPIAGDDQSKVSEHAPSKSVVLTSLAEPVVNLAGSSQGFVILVDDGTEFAQQCFVQLKDKACKVIVMQWPEQYVPSSNKFAGAKMITLVNWMDGHIQKRVEEIASLGPVQGVMLLQPDLQNLTDLEKESYVQAAFMFAKYIQPLLDDAAKKSQRATFLTVARLDGCLGYGELVLKDVTQAALFGLTKTAKQEWTNIFCRAVDISPHIEAEKAASYALRELFDQKTEVAEVAYSERGRQTLEIKDRDSYSLSMGSTVTSESVFLVSGGAKGVTKSCILRLAQQHACRFILLGRSDVNAEPEWANGVSDNADLKRAAMDELKRQQEKPTPMVINKMVNSVLSSREISQTLVELEACGAKAAYLSVDVTNSAELQSKIAPFVASLGKVTGVIHGAGVLADKLIVQKDAADVARVYKTKVAGLESLLSCVGLSSLQHLAVFSSAAGFYGNVGQSDYSAANEVLNKYVLNFKRKYPQCHVLSFNWGPWDGGMVSPALKKMFAERGVYVIPVDSGAQLFVNELVAEDNQQIQILIGTAMTGSDQGDAAEKK